MLISTRSEVVLIIIIVQLFTEESAYSSTGQHVMFVKCWCTLVSWVQSAAACCVDLAPQVYTVQSAACCLDLAPEVYTVQSAACCLGLAPQVCIVQSPPVVLTWRLRCALCSRPPVVLAWRLRCALCSRRLLSWPGASGVHCVVGPACCLGLAPQVCTVQSPECAQS